MTAGEALSGLIAVIGTGGVTTIIVAFLGYKGQAASGRRGEPDGRTVALSVESGAGALDKGASEAIVNAIGTLTGVLLKIAAMMEHEAEERAREREVTAEVERREMRILAEQARGGGKPAR